MEVSCEIVSDTPCEKDLRGSVVVNIPKGELKEAMLYHPLPTGNIKCDLCARRCAIAPGKRGYCGVRENRDGLLYSLVYGKACAWAIDRIEKKPFYHFFPGTESFSFSTVGCNFRCPWCIDGRTLIPIMENGRVKMFHASEFDRYFEGKQSADAFFDASKNNLFVLGVDGWKRVVGVSRRKSDATVLEVKTKRGKKTFVTKDHRILVHNSPVSEKRAQDLEVGDNLILCNSSCIKNGIVELDLEDEFRKSVPEKYLVNITFGKDQLYIKGHNISLPKRLILSEELMRLLGYFVGAGNYEKWGITITASKNEIGQDIFKCCKAMGVKVCERRRKERSPRFTFGGKLYRLLFEYVFGIPSLAPMKRMPWIVFNVEKRLLKEFLSAYMSTDGTIGIRKKKSHCEVRFVTTSSDLKTELCYLLRSFAVDFTIREKTPNVTLPTGHKSKLQQWWICITGWKNLNNLKDIGEFVDRRQDKVDEFLTITRSIDVQYDDSVNAVREVPSSHPFVYDLMLESIDPNWKEHSFFCGDGILVHNCQNWEISQPNQIFGQDLPPKTIVQMTKDAGAAGVAYTYTEPTVFIEYAKATAELARKEGLYNVFVSNGYMTNEAIEEASKFLDAIRIDLKAFNPETYQKYLAADIEVVKHNIAEFNKRMHTEVINLIIPTVNDSDDEIRQLSEWLKGVDPSIPLHFTAYYPANKFTIPPTSAETLQRARKIALDVGLQYVYTGNIPGDPGENTYCPNCDVLLIQRFGFAVIQNNIKDGRCPGCGHQIKIVTKLSWMR